MSKPTVALIGAGAAGTAITLALHRAGYPITAIASRSLDSAKRSAVLVNCDFVGTDLAAAADKAEIIIIATSDSVIEAACQSIASADGFSPRQLVLHLSGALTTDALATARDLGADTLSLHPAQTMVEPQRAAESLKSAWFCLQGNDSAIARGKVIARDISGKTTVIDKNKKSLYHAALSVSSNYLITLESIAVEMLTAAGIPQQEALNFLMPLIQGSVDTLAHNGLPDALTGPISRGDAKTIERHLHALTNASESTVQFYKMMGLEALKLAKAKQKMTQSSETQIQNLLLDYRE
jgi:predicted short-subunit dehydrogenase-like oxidoreductase (DUF2520 family)